jgi:hypothetical protein
MVSHVAKQQSHCKMGKFVTHTAHAAITLREKAKILENAKEILQLS